MSLDKLRQLMRNECINTYVITKFDPHLSEYSCDYWNGVKFISGFSGSAGTVVVTQKDAGLWTDGRYLIQAKKELEGSGIVLYKTSDPDCISYEDFCCNNTPENGVIGFDGRTMSGQCAEELLKKAARKNISFKTANDLLDLVWQNRPPLPSAPVYEHDICFCGESRTAKLELVRNKMAAQGGQSYVISSLDDIAWLFNLRGGDITHTPIFFSFAFLTESSAVLYVSDEKAINVKAALKADGIEVKDYVNIYNDLKGLKGKVLMCPDKNCYELCKYLDEDNIIKIDHDITECLKAIKNNIEIKNAENAHIKDGVAVVRFIKWLKETVKTRAIAEYEVAEKLFELRRQQKDFISESFDTIAAYMSNAAMMHYKADKNSFDNILADGFVLVDSGGQYLDGTTDITRTIAVGQLSHKQRRDFTLTLKAHIALAKAVFLYGATGSNLDTIARAQMWENLMDYKCGTGHGIGFCLGVHEGPHMIRMRPNSVRIEKGMLVTNEPGVYIEGEYGIRIENILAVEEHTTNDFGQFMKFKTISFCPIDLDGIDTSLLAATEKEWLNEYHRTVYDKLSPYLTNDENIFLKNETREIR